MMALEEDINDPKYVYMEMKMNGSIELDWIADMLFSDLAISQINIIKWT